MWGNGRWLQTWLDLSATTSTVQQTQQNVYASHQTKTGISDQPVGMAGLQLATAIGAYQGHSVHHEVWQQLGIHLPLGTDVAIATNLGKHVVLTFPMP